MNDTRRTLKPLAGAESDGDGSMRDELRTMNDER
jgi:hypothetical protein